MSWMWINLPLAVVFFGAWAGIPLYMVLRHPSWSHHPADSAVKAVERLAATEVVAEAVAETAAVRQILLPPGAVMDAAR